MIVAVNNSNKNLWADLCVALWPEVTLDEMIQDWNEGNLPYEFLYFKNDEAIAFISLSLRHDYVEGTQSSPVAYLEGIYVKPEYRNQGIATILIDYAKEWTKANDCSELASDVELHNTISATFHKKLGFNEVNRLICYTMKVK